MLLTANMMIVDCYEIFMYIFYFVDDVNCVALMSAPSLTTNSADQLKSRIHIDYALLINYSIYLYMHTSPLVQ